MDSRFMSTTAVLDVSIGLIMMYFVLSLVCTTINEFIAQLLSLRARTLSSGLDRLIDDNGLLRAVRQHGRIDAIDSLVDEPLLTSQAKASPVPFLAAHTPY